MRIVIPGLAHHITQRGGRKQDVFFLPNDRKIYLKLIKESSDRYGVQVLAYTLMTNHVHLLAVPLESDSLRWTFQIAHKRYADYINGRSNWTGHLWQQRYYSSAVDDEYFWIAMRYILRNPVEAGLALHPAQYEWSSARHHCGSVQDQLISTDDKWTKILQSRMDWHEWLAETENRSKMTLLRKRTAQNMPIGEDEFLGDLERRYGIKARLGKAGRPKNVGNM